MELDHYAIDPTLSSVMVRAFAAAAFDSMGRGPILVIRECGGWARFIPGSFEQACVHIKINAGSVAIDEAVSKEDRSALVDTMRREVLEIDKYPEIVLCSSRISVSKAGTGQYWINLVGDLSLHGVTGTLPIAAQMALAGDTLRAHGEFTLLHTPYKLRLVPMPGASTLKLKDEMKCSFDILARKQTDLAKQEGTLFAAEGS